MSQSEEQNASTPEVNQPEFKIELEIETILESSLTLEEIFKITRSGSIVEETVLDSNGDESETRLYFYTPPYLGSKQYRINLEADKLCFWNRNTWIHKDMKASEYLITRYNALYKRYFDKTENDDEPLFEKEKLFPDDLVDLLDDTEKDEIAADTKIVGEKFKEETGENFFDTQDVSHIDTEEDLATKNTKDHEEKLGIGILTNGLKAYKGKYAREAQVYVKNGDSGFQTGYLFEDCGKIKDTWEDLKVTLVTLYEIDDATLERLREAIHNGFVGNIDNYETGKNYDAWQQKVANELREKALGTENEAKDPYDGKKIKFKTATVECFPPDKLLEGASQLIDNLKQLKSDHEKYEFVDDDEDDETEIQKYKKPCSCQDAKKYKLEDVKQLLQVNAEKIEIENIKVYISERSNLATKNTKDHEVVPKDQFNVLACAFKGAIKEIDDLEKENKNLKEVNESYKEDNKKLAKLEIPFDELSDLKQENAKLKAELEEQEKVKHRDKLIKCEVCGETMRESALCIWFRDEDSKQMNTCAVCAGENKKYNDLEAENAKLKAELEELSDEKLLKERIESRDHDIDLMKKTIRNLKKEIIELQEKQRDKPCLIKNDDILYEDTDDEVILGKPVENPEDYVTVTFDKRKNVGVIMNNVTDIEEYQEQSIWLSFKDESEVIFTCCDVKSRDNQIKKLRAKWKAAKESYKETENPEEEKEGSFGEVLQEAIDNAEKTKIKANSDDVSEGK